LEETVEKGNITYKSKQICVYSHIIVIARNITALKVVLLALEIEGIEKGLRISEKKTKYMKISSTQARRYLQNLTIHYFKFEGVSSFTCLGSVVNHENKMWTFTPKS
jgi:hypothetical protein